MATKTHGLLSSASFNVTNSVQGSPSSSVTIYTVPSNRKATVTLRTSASNSGTTTFTIRLSAATLFTDVLAAGDTLSLSDSGIALGAGQTLNATMTNSGAAGTGASAVFTVYGIEEDA